jgi:ribose transport system permease protein
MQGGATIPWRKPSQTIAMLAMCVILIVAISISLKGFLTVGNLFALSRNISILGILALGMAIVVIARGHDLSQVASLAVSTAIVIIVMNAGYPTAVALLIGLALAIAIGVLNGFLISVIEMPPLLTTVRRQRL